MNYLITAAGKGSRFIKAGIKPPKPLIKVKGVELIIWSLFSFDFKVGDNIYIVTLLKDNVKNRILRKLKDIYPFLNIFCSCISRSRSLGISAHHGTLIIIYRS